MPEQNDVRKSLKEINLLTLLYVNFDSNMNYHIEDKKIDQYYDKTFDHSYLEKLKFNLGLLRESMIKFIDNYKSLLLSYERYLSIKPAENKHELLDNFFRLRKNI